MMSTDGPRVEQVFYYVHYTWAAPLQIAMVLTLLYLYLGPATFAGFGVMILLIPLQTKIAATLGKYTSQTVKVGSGLPYACSSAS